MVGAITSWDILSHPLATARSFGWRVFFRAVLSRDKKTFLSLLEESDFFRADIPELPAIIKRCIGLELRVKRVYTAFARALAKDPVGKGPLSRFFYTLAIQEQEHAELLELCRAATARGGWKTAYLNPWQECVERLEKQMDEVEASTSSIRSDDDLLQLVIQIESLEVNHVFQAILAAANSPFVERLWAFRSAMKAHIAYISRRIPQLAPELTLACRELRAGVPSLR